MNLDKKKTEIIRRKQKAETKFQISLLFYRVTKPIFAFQSSDFHRCVIKYNGWLV